MISAELPLVAVGGLGGTIAMQAIAAGGAVPALSAEALVAAVPQLEALARIEAESLVAVGSPSLRCDDLYAALAWADARVRAGARGVVLTHGTDTLEESAWLLDLLWPHEAPLVLTGAMRAAHMAGADGAANLLAAVQTALSDEARGFGVLACLNDSVHLAQHVSKLASMAVDTFASPGTGPLGRVVEGVFRRDWLLARPRPAALPLPPPGTPQVALLEAVLDDDGRLIDLVARAGYRGLVIAGAGAGHVSAPAADAVSRALAEGVIVVVASRTLQGGTARALYAYKGAEIDLMARGALMAGRLSARKARLLLHVLLASGVDRNGISATLTLYGGN